MPAEIIGGAPGEPVTLAALLERTGFDKGGVNHGVGEVPEGLADLRHRAVTAAEAHMTALRNARAARISPDLLERHRGLREWRDGSLAVLERAGLVAAGGAGAAPAPLRKRLAAERAEIEAIFEERKRFVDRLRTDAAPYLRLAAVFCRPDFR